MEGHLELLARPPEAVGEPPLWPSDPQQEQQQQGGSQTAQESTPTHVAARPAAAAGPAESELASVLRRVRGLSGPHREALLDALLRDEEAGKTEYPARPAKRRRI